jgi:hypothetical protein
VGNLQAETLAVLVARQLFLPETAQAALVAEVVAQVLEQAVEAETAAHFPHGLLTALYTAPDREAAVAVKQEQDHQ